MGHLGLDPRERAELERDGFVLRRSVFGAGELQDLADGCEELVQRLIEARRRTKYPAGSYVFELQRALGTVVKWEKDCPDVILGVEPFAHLSERLRDWALDARLLDPIKDIVLADEVELFTEKLNLKRARVGGPIALHQDYPYWVDVADDATRIATALLFLDEATCANGCLEVAPGSHRSGVQSRLAVEGFGSFEMDPEKYEVDRLVAVEVPAGSVLYFGPFLVHRSRPNTTGEDRRALLYSYQPAGRRHLREFLGLGRSQGTAAS